MGQLADRFAELCREYGSDPSARASDVHALAALEERDPKEAHERFVALRKELAVTRRAELLHALKGFAFVRDVPPPDVRGMGQKEIDREIRWAAASLRRARAIVEALAEEAAHRAALGLPQGPPLAPAPWDDLAAPEAEAEARRRTAARDARLAQRAADVRRRGARHGLDVPAGADHDALDALEARLAEAEALSEAFDAVSRALRSPDVGEWRRESRRALEREADALRAAGDAAGLRALAPRAEALRAEAARLASEAARARRSGRAAPARERRAGDPLDPYG